MDRDIRNKVEMAVRALEFSSAFPSADASYAPVLVRFGECVIRLRSLSAQQLNGQTASRASRARRRELRHLLHESLLRHLVTVAEVAAEGEPAIANRFRLPATNASNEAFRTAARALLEAGESQRELLSRHGLAGRLLEDLRAAVDQYDAAVEEANAGRRDHVRARVELKAVTDEVMQLVTLLDGLNRYRYAKDPGQLAAWESARNVASAGRAALDGAGVPAAIPVSVPVPAPAVAPPASGEVKPAA